MERNNKGSENSDKSENLAENALVNKIIKGAIAWAILVLVGTTVWRMAEPVISNNANLNATSEATATVSSQVENAKGSTTEKPKKESNDLSLPSGADRVQVTASALNVRAEPDLKSEKVTTLSRGTIIQVVGESGQWIKVRTAQGDVGYVKKSPELIRPAP